MKRKLALLILIILAVSLLLVACDNSKSTTPAIRWTEEKHVFHISLADFTSDESYSAFKKYNADGSINNAYGEYRKDKAIITGESAFSTRDDVVPVNVYGTYTLTITPTPGSGTCDVKGEQILYAQYKKSDVEGWKDLTTLLNKAAEYATEIEKTGLVSDEENVVLRSETVTTVKFKVPSQAPLSSATKVDGFYIGRANREITAYEISTEYNYDNEKKPTATVTFDGKEPTTYNLPAATSTVDVIDSNQILIYVRSLNKSSSSLQGRTATVFNPFAGKTHTASFAYSSYEDKMILTDYAATENNTVAAKLNSMSVTIDGIAYMLQENLPALKLGETNLDVMSGVQKYTTVHFRVGFLSYEIEYSNEENAATGWDQIWEALTPVVEPEEDQEEQE